MDSVFFALEIVGCIAFAVSGSMIAIRNEMDIFGVAVLGLLTAVGGGIIRDSLLGITPPTSLENPFFCIVAIAASLVVCLPYPESFLRHMRKFNKIILFAADSVGLGVFTVIGVQTCVQTVENPSVFLCVAMGVITGVGGGFIRDVASGKTPYILVKHFYACASIIGAFVCATARSFLPELTTALLSMAIVIFFRILAAVFHWNLPKPAVGGGKLF